MSEFIEFGVQDFDRFEALQRVFGELKGDKDRDEWRPEHEWLSVFDEQARSRFDLTEPVDAGESAWRPVAVTPTEQTTGIRWHFHSLLEAFRNGEYELQTCELVAPGRARLTFCSFAYPYGGVGCMVALIEAFGFRITGIDDGTGLIEP